VTKPSIQGVINEIIGLTNFLVEEGFADDQNFPIRRGDVQNATISFPNQQFAPMLKNIPYENLYASMRGGRSYNILMLDGALIQISYEFVISSVTRCRLAFLPSPTLEAFQNAPELYEDDLMYAEAVMRQAVTVPIRFEFDDREGVPKNIDHPRSHVTLGQYSNCRIPVSAPITPGIFIGFILRSFYNTAIRVIAEGAPCAAHRWERTITSDEAGLLHLTIP
jgi:hypothetical protein